MKPAEFHAIYRELIEENPLAVRAVLQLLSVEFRPGVPTLAVTCEERPRLLVNLGFLARYCATEAEVKAVICHEFLHVLLRHTEGFAPATPAEHIALDAVVNAIIHRTLGPDYSALMSRYYAAETGLARLLRPPRPEELAAGERDPAERRLCCSWQGLYSGTVVADDIRDLAADLGGASAASSGLLLGGHDRSTGARPLPAALAAALDRTLRSMNGAGIFRSPRGRGFGAPAYRNVVLAADLALHRWRREAWEVLRRHLLPDARSAARESTPARYELPVLSPSDRRAVLAAAWSPFLPEASWQGETPRRPGSAHVYLDVSGSMDAEMPHLVALLARLTPYIRRPFYAFSTQVEPARIARGRLLAETTGGTSINCVLEHLVRTRPRAAVVVTDGYIEEPDRALVLRAAGTRLHAIVTRDGCPRLLRGAGIACTQLSRLPS